MTDAGLTTLPGKNGWRTVLPLVVLCALPVAVAGTLYLSGWRPATSAAHGILVQPPLPVAQVVLGESAGKTVRLGDFRSKWTLLYFGPADCRVDCRHSLTVMRQVHIAQGREQGRVQRVFVMQGALPQSGENSFSRDFPDMVVVESRVADGKNEPAGWAGKGRIFLIDPLGNRVMDYEADTDPGGIRKDLARLLAYSWVG